MVEEMLAARRILVSHETVRQWAQKFGQSFAIQISRLPLRETNSISTRLSSPFPVGRNGSGERWINMGSCSTSSFRAVAILKQPSV
jgi:hypothetical protein